MKKNILIIIVALGALFSSCSKDFLETKPSSSVSDVVALSSLGNIEYVLRGVYITMGHQYFSANMIGYSYFNLADDLTASTMSQVWYWGMYGEWNAYRSESTGSDSWSYLYNLVLKTNDIILGLEALEIDESQKELHSDLLGQALTLRALFYDNLNLHFSTRYDKATAATNLSVPIRKNRMSEPLPRLSQEEVVDFIFTDIDRAIGLFSEVENVRSTEYLGLEAAKMIKLRLLMYTGQTEEVVTLAEDMIEKTQKSIMGADLYADGFNNKENQEWIFATVISPSKPVGAYFQGMWINYDYGGYGVRDSPCVLDLSYLYGMDESDVILVATDETPIADKFEGKIPNTKNLTMRSSDSRYDLFLHDTKEEIAENIRANPYHYVQAEWCAIWYAKIHPGLSRKYKEMNGDRKADVVMMRLSEIYYIGAEAASLRGNDALARRWLSAIVEPYDAGATAYIASKSGEELRTLIANYKAVDMWGEGRVLPDVKRRTNWVYRLAKYNTLKGRYNEQYKSVSPFIHTSADEQYPIYFKDIMTFPIPKPAMDANPLLVQNLN